MSNEVDLEDVVIRYGGEDEKDLHEMVTKFDKALPEAIITEFEAIGQYEDFTQWKKGDLTNQIWSVVVAKKLKNKKGVAYTFIDVCYYVSVRFMRGTRSYNTVKAWALTARRYSPAVRKKYSYDILPFSHFAFAAKRIFDVDSSVSGGKVWQDILDFSLDFANRHARVCSVRALENKYETGIKPKRTYVTGLQTSGEEIITPVTLADVKTAVDQSIEDEFEDLVFKLGAFISRFSVKYPMFTDPLSQGYALILNVLQRALGK